MSNQYKKDIRGWVKGMKASILDFKNAVSVEMHTRIVQGTPIDTGRAKASWNINPGTADESVYPVVPENAKLPREVAHAEAFSKHPIAFKTKNPITVISNNLDYIVELENGKSRQSPPGYMVQMVLTEYEEDPKSFSNVPF